MKKTLSLIAMIFLVFPSFAVANSGPTYWYHHPSSEILVVEQASPIQVLNEHLLFDFSNENHQPHWISGKVTAAYEMYNPTNETQRVQMLFPFATTLTSFSEKDVIVTAGGETLPYELFIGEVVYGESKEIFQFDRIVSQITNKPYEPTYFSNQKVGKLYIIEATPTTEETTTLNIQFEFDLQKTKVFTKGFTGYGMTNGKAEISAWIFEPTTLHLFVIGEDIDFRSSGKVTTSILTKEVTVKEYFSELIEEIQNEVLEEKFEDGQLYEVFVKALDESFANTFGLSSEFMLLDQLSMERILSLAYTVEFPPTTKKQVTVSYLANGTMDKTKTNHPLYTFHYLLNPAKNWSDFKNLHVRIITPSLAPYIVDSSFEVKKEADNVYEAFFTELPEEDLSFTLHYEEEISSSFSSNQLNFILIGSVIFVLLAIVLMRKNRMG